MTIAKIFNEVLKRGAAGLFWVPLLLLTPVLSMAQNTVTVRGRVMNDNNVPVPGASVTIKNESKGAVTDSLGNFVLSMPSKTTLVISAVGYLTREVSAKAGHIDIVLTAGSKDLDQVIVIGYGSQRKADVTGSVANISGATLNQVPGDDITRALQGRIAGVDMQQTSSKPGASLQIRIRGTRSLNATNDPLIVLDGIPFIGTINDISPAEIKSVDILKDASATAIYGSRGANGVILITTNKGTAGQKAHLAYSGYTGLKKVWGEYPMMSGPEFAALRQANNATPGASIHTNTLDENDSVNTDWQKLLYQDGYEINQDLSVTGGSERGNYSIGLNYFKDQAVIPLQYYERYSIRTSLEQKIGSLFRIGLTTNNYYVNNHDQNLGPGSTLGLSPIINPRNPDGSWKSTVNENTSGPVWAYTAHALKNLGDQYIDLDRAITSNNSIFGEINIPGVSGLKYRINLGLYVHQDDYGTYTGTGVFSGTPTTASSAGISDTKQTDYTIENLLTYDHTFAKKHRLSLTGLYSVEQNTKWSSSASATHLPSDAFQFYNLSYVLADQSGVSTVGGGSYAQYGLLSYMGRIIYTFNDKYMLTAAFRSDASSVLATGHQWHSYPAISAGWNMKNERFMDNVTWVDGLKPRIGYGETSNQAISPYQTLGALTTSPYNFGPSGYAMGYYVTQLPNPSLGWEFSKTWNYGVDFSLLKGRVSGTAEYYTINTSNVLLSVGLPTTSGVSSYTANIGATQNKGFELSLNGTILDNFHGWTWDVGVNVYRNKNRLVSLYSGQPYDKGNQWFPGHPIDVMYDYKKVGLMTYADSASGYLQAAYPGGNVGMIKVAYNSSDTSLHYDAHGVPNRKIGAGSALNNDDRQIYDMEPNFEGGFNTYVAYKNVDLTITGFFRSGGTLVSTLYGSAGYLNNLNTRAGNNVEESYWTPTRPDAAKFNTFAPRPGGVGGDNPAFGSTLSYFSASFMKVRTISLGYNFSQKWLKKASVEHLRVYCTVENPFVFFSPYTKMSHMDPETNSYADQNTAVSAGPHRILTVGTNTPSTRNYVFGINVTF
jgi:TonB-linked SusC/RagA family outer membrane protein